MRQALQIANLRTQEVRPRDVPEPRKKRGSQAANWQPGLGADENQQNIANREVGFGGREGKAYTVSGREEYQSGDTTLNPAIETGF